MEKEIDTRNMLAAVLPSPASLCNKRKCERNCRLCDSKSRNEHYTAINNSAYISCDDTKSVDSGVVGYEKSDEIFG